MESIHRKAIEAAIAIENRNLDYCRAVMSKVTKTTTRRVFELLAEGKAGHVGTFCRLFTGCAGELDTILTANSMYADPYYRLLLDSIDGDSPDLDALRIALREEQACIELYTVFVDIFREPHVRGVFARILDETRGHGNMIREEYDRIMNVAAGTAPGCLCV